MLPSAETIVCPSSQVLEGVEATLLSCEATSASSALAGVDMYPAAQQAYKQLTTDVRPRFDFSPGALGLSCQCR